MHCCFDSKQVHTNWSFRSADKISKIYRVFLEFWRRSRERAEQAWATLRGIAAAPRKKFRLQFCTTTTVEVLDKRLCSFLFGTDCAARTKTT